MLILLDLLAGSLETPPGGSEGGGPSGRAPVPPSGGSEGGAPSDQATGSPSVGTEGGGSSGKALVPPSGGSVVGASSGQAMGPPSGGTAGGGPPRQAAWAPMSRLPIRIGKRDTCEERGEAAAVWIVAEMLEKFLISRVLQMYAFTNFSSLVLDLLFTNVLFNDIRAPSTVLRLFLS